MPGNNAHSGHVGAACSGYMCACANLALASMTDIHAPRNRPHGNLLVITQVQLLHLAGIVVHDAKAAVKIRAGHVDVIVKVHGGRLGRDTNSTADLRNRVCVATTR